MRYMQLHLLIIVLFSVASTAYAEDEEALLNFNKTMYIYQNTALIEVTNIERAKKVYVYQAKVLDKYKGNISDNLCLTEATTNPEVKGSRIIVSFDFDGKCHFLDVGNKVSPTERLLSEAKSYSEK